MADVEDMVLIHRNVSANIDLKPGKEKFFSFIPTKSSEIESHIVHLGNIHNVLFYFIF